MNRQAAAILGVGALILCVGLWLVFPAAAFIAAGLLVMAAGALLLDVGGDQ